MTFLPALFSTLIFVGSLALIFSEKVNRVIVAVGGAALMIIVGRIFGFYSEDLAIAAIDFNTLGLLLGMMILVAMLEPTGFFEYLAVRAARASFGKPLRLFALLGGVTSVLSMFLDNVTTVVLIAPVTILISEILGVSPLPYLMSEAILSNVGGVSTLVGDPPNALIGSAAGLSFNDFLIYALPVVFIVWASSLFLLQYLFRRELSKRPRRSKAVMNLNPEETLNQPETAKKVLVVLGGAILFFFAHHRLKINPSLVALSAAAAALLWARPNIQETLNKVEWSVLMFFGALFIIVGGLERSGSLQFAVQALNDASKMPPLLFGLVVIWLTALISALVGNVPITIALIPVIQGLAQNGAASRPLWWALVFGAGFGGNGTIFGSAANLIVAALSEKTRAPITAKMWSKRGLPVALISCVIASLLYALIYRWM